MPSSLIERRPDIRAAEQNLISANAQIGVAKAYYFPQISLTGILGGQSRALTQLFTGPAAYLTVSPDALLPIFNAGQVRVAVRLSEAQKREMLTEYQKAIYNGIPRSVGRADPLRSHARAARPAGPSGAGAGGRPRAFRRCATSAAPTVTCRCSAPSAICSRGNSSRRSCVCRNCSPSSISIGHWVAA